MEAPPGRRLAQAPGSVHEGLEEAAHGEEHNMKERGAALDATFEVIMRMSLYDDEDECELSAEDATTVGMGALIEFAWHQPAYFGAMVQEQHRLAAEDPAGVEHVAGLLRTIVESFPLELEAAPLVCS